jgi:hypothetical protein
MKGSGKNTIHFKNQFSYFTGTCEAHVKDHSFHHSFQKTSFFILPIWLYYNISNIYHIASTKWRDHADSETESLQSSNVRFFLMNLWFQQDSCFPTKLLSSKMQITILHLSCNFQAYYIFFSVRKMSWIKIFTRWNFVMVWA